MTQIPDHLRLVEPRPTPLASAGHSVRVPGVLSDTLEKKFVLIDEDEVLALAVLGSRLDELGASGVGGLLDRIVRRWNMGDAA